jgi:hypothetical protein
MTPDTIIVDRENRIPTSIEIKIVGLSLPPESARPINKITKEDVTELKTVLVESGFNLTLSPEGIASIREPQFRDLKTGKGPALVESLGLERATEFFAKCEQIVSEYPHIQKFKTGGVGIGLKHTLIDLIALCVLPEENWGRIVEHVNQRVVYGYDKEDREFALANSFKNVPKIDEPKKKATVPVGSILKLWDFIARSSK